MFDFSFEFLSVVEEAAIASARSMGLADAETSDRLAVEKMRAAMDLIPMHGTIVIGEGERDEAPMLFIGEHVGMLKDSPTQPGLNRCRSARRNPPVRHRGRRCHYRPGRFRTRWLTATHRIAI